jgi:hypothetical protein
MKSFNLQKLSRKTGHGVPQLFTWHKPIVTGEVLSDDQLAAFEARLENPVDDVMMAAPVAPGQRLAIRGRVKRMRLRETMYGSKNSLTVKVEGSHGVWFAIGSCPQSLRDAKNGDHVGMVVTFKNVHRDKPYFAYYRRPSKAAMIEEAADPDLALMLKDKYGLEQDFSIEPGEERDPFERFAIGRKRRRSKPGRSTKKEE